MMHFEIVETFITIERNKSVKEENPWQKIRSKQWF